MAIGFVRFGFRLSENFRWPYGAKTLTEFWRRWNISLIDWCRGYLGLSLEDATESRVLRARRLVVLFLCVWLWHGPGWNVMLWGLLHGVVVALEQDGLGACIRRLPRRWVMRICCSWCSVCGPSSAPSRRRAPSSCCGPWRVHRCGPAVVTRADAAPVDRADDRRAGRGAALAWVQPMDCDG